MRRSFPLLPAALGALFFLPFLGGVHLFDWDEVNFAEISREMIVMDDYLRVHVNFLPFWEKPPLFFWMQALAMHAFGVGEYAARLPNALCGVATLVVLYRVGEALYDARFGWLWGLTYFGSVLPHLYFKSGIIDPWFNLFIFLALYQFIRFHWRRDGLTDLPLRRGPWFYLITAGLWLGLAVLTKGPVAYLIVCLCFFIYWIFQRFRLYVSVPQFIVFSLITALLTLTWYGVETIKNGPWFVQEFVRYQYRLFSTPDAGHRGFFGYHFVVLFFGCFPASVFALRAFVRMPVPNRSQQNFRLWMVILFWVVLVLFTIVKSKIVHYSSMAYFPLTYLAALTAYQISRRRIPFRGWMSTTLLAIVLLAGGIIIAMPFVGMRAEELLTPLLAKDPFAAANLRAQVRWTGWEAVAGVVFIGVVAAGVRLLRRGRFEAGFGWLYGGTAVSVLLILIFFIGRVEQYSQAAAVEFFEAHADEDAYRITIGYKSYVPMFYGRTQPEEAPTYPEFESKSAWHQQLLHGEIDKPLYISTKINRQRELEGVGGLEKLGERNGFVFYRRAPNALD
ncbi:MAG: glycosyltransferase family 39 protein [Catalinimonas sp.]